MMDKAGSYINGEWRVFSELLEIHNPSKTQELVGVISLCSQEGVNTAVGASHKAFREWKNLGQAARGALLFKAADRLEGALEELAQLASREMGKPLAETRGEAQRAVAILRYFGGEGLRAIGEVIPAVNASTLQYTTRAPLGPVAIITPWNFPLAIPMWKMAPALVYGNTVVLKPAEWATLTAVKMVALMADLFPAGVLNLVSGIGRETGEWLIQHQDIKGISFTGSSVVGGHIAEVAIQRGIKYQTEMGGKNAVVIADDADLNTAVNVTLSGAMRSAGQKCTATSRVIVMREVHDEFIERLRQRVIQLKVGNPLEEDTYLGPVVSESQYRKVLDYLSVGAEEATLVAGGREASQTYKDGYFVAPTLFDNVGVSARIAQEEIFGPVVATLTVDSLDEAIAVTNGIRYGLSASIFTKSLQNALYFVDQVEVGLVRVNEETAGVELQAPFGGMKASSSHSREQGRAAIDFYTDVRTVAIRP